MTPDHPVSVPTRQPSFVAEAAALARDFADLVLDHVELAALEARRAAGGLAKMLSAAVVVSLLVITAWLALVAGGIVWATDVGVGWPIALAIAALANLLLAGIAVYWIRSQVHDFLFSATLRQLRRTTHDAKEDVA